MTVNLNISGVLVHARPHMVESVKTAISELGDIEIHAITDEGRFVVTMEVAEDRAGDKLVSLQNIPGVLSAAMVYAETFAPTEPEAMQ